MFQLDIDDEISLQLIREKHVRALFHLTDQSRAALQEWLPWLETTKTEGDSLQYIKASIAGFEEKKNLNCGIFYQGELVGVAGFNSIDWQNEIVYIGYWLGTNFEGNGIVTRAVRGLIDFAFTEMRMNRVDIRAAVDNTKSRAIPKKLGFKEEGLIRQGEWLYDHYVDHVIYGLLKAEW